jgi:hypothetical protein
MAEPVSKRVDESWKERVEQEKTTASQRPAPEPPRATEGPTSETGRAGPEELPQARFDLFVQGLLMEALMALGEMPNPGTRKQAVNLPQARYLIDLLGMLEEKTRGNLSVDEERLLKDAVYQLRMRYLAKAGG